MSLPTSAASNQATRCGNRAHKASVGRQRKHASAVTPCEQALAIAKVVRKRIADGQAVPDLDRYGLTNQTWAELLDVLTADELGAVGDACSADDITRAFEDDVPLIPSDTIPPAPQPGSKTAHSWRDREPAIVHSLKWRDAEGIEHLHVIRADTLDEALVHVKKLKLCIAAARAKSPSQAADIKESGSVSPRRCAMHNAEMTRRMSKRTGKLYSAHDTAEGLCFGRKA